MIDSMQKSPCLAALLFLFWGWMGCTAPAAHPSPEENNATTDTWMPELPKGDGTLFIIGGGERPPQLVANLLDRMDSRDALVLVLPMASEEPDSATWYARKMFVDAGATNVREFILSAADSSAARLDSLNAAALIYLCGGDQSRLMEAIGHPSIKKQIHRSFERGAIVAGTSAGAAVMSGVMITGDQRLEPEYESTYRRLRANNAVYAEGLGLLPNAIVDQHFVERSRYNRAITALHDYPEQTVFGIGESTALVVTSTGMEAIGEGQIVVFRNGALSASPDGRIEGDLSIEIWVGH